ncbi:von Willebrand factor type A domain-containing protein [Xylaria sp. FL1042]|nr:von Willebrand factor type A domain-containing protein [Xylaria sp. FL1042]
MSVFSAGIARDPREPLPPEYIATTSPIFPSTAIEESDRNVLPALSVSIEARVTGDVAEVTAKQLFWNDADVPIYQGSYTFALPNGCTVTDFTCRLGNGKLLKAIARPKAEAEMKFQQALASHTTVALLEQNIPEIFTFGQGTNTRTLISLIYIANRYGQRLDSLQGHLETKHDNISLRIEILESGHSQSVKSASHEILVERGTEMGQAFKWNDIGVGSEDTKHETAIITMKEVTSWIERDFIISIDTSSEMHPSFEDQAVLMNETSKTGEIIFVVDRSGSMEDKMENLKSAMHFFLKGIPVGQTFNIWSFGSHYSSLWAKSRVYGENSLQIALNYVDTEFDADMGGTEILPALETIIAARDPSLPFWRLDDTLSLVGKAKEASNGGGYSEVIPQADKEALTTHVHNLTNLHSLNPFQAHRIFLLLEKEKIPENNCICLTFISDGKRTAMNALIIRPENPGTLILALLDNLERKVPSSPPYQPEAFLAADRVELDEWLFAEAIAEDEIYFEEAKAESYESCFAMAIACRHTLPYKWTSLFLENDDGMSEDKSNPSIVNEISMTHIQGVSLQRNRGTNAKLSAKKQFISFILGHQAFDGSIRSEALSELPEVARDIVSAIKNWLCEKTNLKDPILDPVANNIAFIMEILERDFKDYESLHYREGAARILTGETQRAR